LIAAPVAGLAWLALLVLQPAHRRPAAARSTFLIVMIILSIGSALLFGLLHQASAGWFALHVVGANANRWDGELARAFWTDVMQLHWPLALAALLSGLIIIFANTHIKSRTFYFFLLPIFYTLGGIVTALGVGKVGAYTNYFLELYAGLIWLAGAGYGVLVPGPRETDLPAAAALTGQLPAPGWTSLTGRWALLILLIGTLVYYPPTWSPTTLHRAGLLEPSPPRMAFGQYNLWHDTRRETVVLAALERVHTALIAEVRAAGPVIFTDIPGVAAQADRLSRYQAFEQRQLLDQGYLEQHRILLELANGEISLAVIDFLGNWLTPEMVELLQRRYAQDGALGTFDRYRPVAPGPRTPLNRVFDVGLRLRGYHLAAPAGRTGRQFDAGALLIATLEWERDAQHEPHTANPEPADDIMVQLQLTNQAEQVVAMTERPLLYGVLPSAEWLSTTPVQHMQPLRLPPDLPPGRYSLALGLQRAGQMLAPAREIGHITVQIPRGRYFAETDYFVPAPLLHTWQAIGGLERAGYPLTPAVPFAWGTLQCFERTCLEWRDGRVEQRSLGTEHYLAETVRSTACRNQQPATAEQRATVDPTHPAICPAFAKAWTDYGGLAAMGPALSGEVPRNVHVVQWTRYARLERLPESDQVHLGRLGDEALRLPPGTRYRWP
jgi:flagellar biosynthesis protein FliQ